MDEIVNTDAKKGRMIRSVSLLPEDDALITYLDISLSGILREKIKEIREHSENWRKLIFERDDKIVKMAKLIEEQANEIERLKNGVV